jgi:hypothetical protein
MIRNPRWQGSRADSDFTYEVGILDGHALMDFENSVPIAPEFPFSDCGTAAVNLIATREAFQFRLGN